MQILCFPLLLLAIDYIFDRLEIQADYFLDRQFFLLIRYIVLANRSFPSRKATIVLTCYKCLIFEAFSLKTLIKPKKYLIQCVNKQLNPSRYRIRGNTTTNFRWPSDVPDLRFCGLYWQIRCWRTTFYRSIHPSSTDCKVPTHGQEPERI